MRQALREVPRRDHNPFLCPSGTLTSVQLAFPSDAVVVVAGVPGAGKTTLIRRAVDREVTRVVDTDDRRRGRLLYLGHYVRIAAAIAGDRKSVV